MIRQTNARVIAFYLPQFHPIPENDKWWGKGFTEWTNVKKAKPVYRGHIQPRIPADLGYYDLRDPKARMAQADLAREYGVEGFCYWHYWLGDNKRLLERPFEEVLNSGQPDFPFCLGWANHSWTGVWFGAPDTTLAAQNYPGLEDYVKHFNYVLKAFLDPRYIRVDGKPLFLVFRSKEIPHAKQFTDLWRTLALEAGLKGIHFVAHDLVQDDLGLFGFDACTYSNHRIVEHRLPKNRLARAIAKKTRRLMGRPVVFRYEDAMPYFVRYNYKGEIPLDEYPCAVSNWDSSPRLGEKHAVVLHNSTPALFKQHLEEVVDGVRYKPYDRRIVFLKSWNEWAEGNYVEPDKTHGHGYLRAIKEVLLDSSSTG